MADPIINLPRVKTFQSVALRGSDIELQWEIHNSDSWPTLAMPIPEAEKLHEYLSKALQDIRSRT